MSFLFFKQKTAYEMRISDWSSDVCSSDLIRDIAGTFIPSGFSVAAPVFEHFSAPEILRAEVEQDIEHGLLTKTAIHPDQISVIHSVYRPEIHEMNEDRAILSHERSEENTSELQSLMR